MKALVLENVGKLVYKDIPVPEPKEGEVLVRVKAAGICGSDIQRVYKDGAHVMPLVIGHEFAGCVKSVGPGVSKDLIGKRVGIFPLIPCEKCGPCKNKQYEMCRNYNYLGSRCNGGFAEYVAVPERNIIELPESVSYEQAAMLEPMAVAVHSMRRIGEVSEYKDKRIAVCGLGTIGTILVKFLLDAGCKDIVVIGNKESQKRRMVELGIPEDKYFEETNIPEVDVFFECVGRNETVSLAVSSVAPAGSICFVGNPASDMMLTKDVYWKILRNQIRITGTWNSSFTGADDDWHYVLDRLENGDLGTEQLITKKYSLEDITEGFEVMRDKSMDYIKIMAVME